MGAPTPPKLRIKVGFLFVALLVGEEASFFFFLTEGSVPLPGNDSMRPVRFRVFMAGVRGRSAQITVNLLACVSLRTILPVVPIDPSLRPFRTVPLSFKE